jgi:nucleoside-diphosphate-sugar epimerase
LLIGLFFSFRADTVTVGSLEPSDYMPTALLTGATGFLGAHVARALSSRGWTIRALCRRPLDPDGLLAGVPLETVRGDLFAREEVVRAAAGCDAIVHVAGVVKARTLEEYRSVNAAGTEALLAAARQAAPSAMWIQVSSQAAAGPAVGGRPVREGDPARPVSWYGLSKREGELAVERGWTGPWVVLRPAVIFGAGDRGLLPLFRAASRGWVPAPAAGSRIQVIAAERAAAAIAVAAGDRDLSGRTGFLCDPDPVMIRDFARMIAQLPRRRARVVGVPSAFVRLVAAAETLREALTRKSRPFNADKAREALAGDWLCDPEPLISRLCPPPAIALAQGLRGTWDWYEEHGWLTL